MPPPPLLSKHALSRIQHCVPKSWRQQQQQQQSPTALIDSIRSLSADGRLAPAFTAYSRLRRLRPPPPHLLLHPISSLLACSPAPQGLQLHAHVLSLGVHNNPYLVSRLTAFYTALDLLDNARLVVKCSTTLIARPWNLLIAAYIRKTAWRDAILAYRLMLDRGVVADEFTYTSLLRACGETGDLCLGQELHRLIYMSGFDRDMFVGNALVAMYVKCGELVAARKMFDGMPDRDVFTCNSMILGYVSEGMWEQATALIPEGFEVNVVTWNTVIGGYLRMGNHLDALRLISQMRTSESAVDSVTLVIGLKACAQIQSVRPGKEIHGLAVRMHWDELEHVRNMLITMYLRCGRTSCAYALFRGNAGRSLVTWNAVIAGLARAGRVEEASWMCRDMARSGLQPNDVTVVTILSLCSRIGNFKHGRELHCFITRRRFEGCLSVWNSLVDMYSKSGRISTAQRVFDMMSNHDVVSYTSMILGYGMKGEGISSLKLFEEMIRRGFIPDHITLVAVLSACSHSGLVAQGQIIFGQMDSLYGVLPRLEHYSCMVALYGRAGFLSKAEEILLRMPLQPSTAMLATLVVACLIHGNTEIGKRSADRLMNMRSDNPSHYFLVADMYAYARCWEELAKVRALMRDMGIRKAIDYSRLDLCNEFFRCPVEDKSDPHVYEISMQFKGLDEHISNGRYVGNEKFNCNEGVG